MPKKKKRGRKPITIDLEKVKLYASRGLTEELIAVNLGVHKSTYFEKKSKNYSEFSDAVLSGKAYMILDVANETYKLAKKGHFQAQKFLLETKGGFRSESKIERIVEKEFGGDPESIAKAFNLLAAEEKQKTLEFISQSIKGKKC